MINWILKSYMTDSFKNIVENRFRRLLLAAKYIKIMNENVVKKFKKI